MELAAFAGLPDQARLYIFGSSRPLTPPEQERVRHDMNPFVVDWKAHGDSVTGAWDIVYDRFLLVAVDEERTALSGCSIDSLTRVIKTLEQDLGLTLFDGGAVLFRDDSGIRHLSRPDFGRLAQTGQVSGDTIVFDNTLHSLRPLREGKWEVPARKSWHARAFHLGTAAAPRVPGQTV